MDGISIAWGYALWMINMACGAMIVQHAVCNLSRWQYSIRSMALWGNALLLGGGLRVLLASMHTKTLDLERFLSILAFLF